MTVTATDAAGNTNSCTFNVTVNDIQAPAVSCPSNIVVSNDAGECGAVVDFAASATDNCSSFGGSSAPSASLVITGIFDGPLSGGIPKFIELYAIEDITDLSIYGIAGANNAAVSFGTLTPLAGSATAGQYLYVASEATSLNTYFGFSQNFTSGALNVNGDDVVGLFQNSNLIDVFGVLGQDGTGTAWDYLDGWAYRNNNMEPRDRKSVV